MDGQITAVSPQSGGDNSKLRDRIRTTLTGLSRTGRLPALPGVATAALGMARNPNADLKALARLVQTDVGLVARLLRVANAPAYGRRSKTQSVKDAVVTVGMRQTCDLLVAISVRQLYVTSVRGMENLWDYSLAVAVAAEELGNATGRARPGTAFLPGLLHDVGRIAFLMADAKTYEKVWRRMEAGEGSGTELERETYEFDHAQVGGILVEDWGLTREQVEAVRSHHDPELADAGHALATVLNGADHLAHVMGHGTTSRPPADVSLEALCLSPEEEAACAARAGEAFTAQKALVG